MDFDKLDSEEVIYENGDWRATRDSILGGIFIFQADYERGFFVCMGYASSIEDYYLDDITLEEVPSSLRDIILREVM